MGGRIGEQHDPHRTVKMLIERELIGLKTLGNLVLPVFHGPISNGLKIRR